MLCSKEEKIRRYFLENTLISLPCDKIFFVKRFFNEKFYFIKIKIFLLLFPIHLQIRKGLSFGNGEISYISQ